MNEKYKRSATTAERLRQALDMRHMKQIELATLSGINKGAISHYIAGDYEPKNETLHKLAKALEVNEMWLWGYDGVEPDSSDPERKFLQMFGKLTPDQKKLIMNMIKELGGTK